MVATRLLENRARTWWNSVKSRSTTPQTWSDFLKEFDEEYETRFNELMLYVLDLVKSEQNQANYFEERLHNEIRERMTVIGREPHKEVVHMALRAKKLEIENRRIWTEFAKRKNSSVSSNQPQKRGKDSSALGSTTFVSVTSPRPPFSQAQHRPPRFNISEMTTFEKSFRGHFRSDCPLLRRATATTSSPPAQCNTSAYPPSRPQTRSSTRVFVVMEDEARVRLGVVTGTMFLFDKDAYVLIDSGSDRSYVSTTFASIADRNLSPLEGEIVVHAPLEEQLIRNTCYKDYGIRVGGEPSGKGKEIVPDE
ncbi:Gag protease polyprotein, putative [Theobroma cacao]|uniref:Gag protease polyprotein, putative n=1 Tax=Theobroma cacao TaxID=3641 RepID=A0A061DLB6_THECC|nr:Gag protease polyprotein, putative [Theobroma cacao]